MLQDDELKRHILDLAQRSYNQNVYSFSDFLSLAEQSVVYSLTKELNFIDYDCSGGINGAERVMFRFGSNNMFGYVEEFPIVVLVARPLMKKFADELTHRDFLGALMNLGIQRSVLGDIVIRDNVAFIFCNRIMADYICDNLVQVKHTSVSVTVSDTVPEMAAPVLKEEEHVISSNRCDAVVSKVYNLSRSQSQELFKSKKIFVDGRQCENASLELKNDAVVSVRGFGKFIFIGSINETRKGRVRILIKRYI